MLEMKQSFVIMLKNLMICYEMNLYKNMFLFLINYYYYYKDCQEWKKAEFMS